MYNYRKREFFTEKRDCIKEKTWIKSLSYNCKRYSLPVHLWANQFEDYYVAQTTVLNDRIAKYIGLVMFLCSIAINLSPYWSSDQSRILDSFHFRCDVAGPNLLLEPFCVILVNFFTTIVYNVPSARITFERSSTHKCTHIQYKRPWCV